MFIRTTDLYRKRGTRRWHEEQQGVQAMEELASEPRRGREREREKRYESETETKRHRRERIRENSEK